MPLFKVIIGRKVSTIEQFERTIDADDENDAWNIAREMTDEGCPDDCLPTGEIHIGDFYVETVTDDLG